MRELVFLIGAQSSQFGSVHLRAIQLEELVREGLRQRGFRSSVARGLPRQAGAVFFATKSFALDFGVAGFEEIAAQGGEIIFDPLDMKMGEDFRELALRSACLVASSLTQRDYFAEAFGRDMRVAFVPHHVDTRLPEVRCQMERFRVAYIGAPFNAKLPRRKKWFQLTDWRARFTEICDVIDASRYDDTGWMQALQNYNCHYLFREKQSFDGFKPFLKGYIAAHCGAVVMALRHDTEAVANLGADYPFLFDVRRSRDIVGCVERASASFGSPAWTMARERVATLNGHCQKDKVIDAFLAAVTNDAASA